MGASDQNADFRAASVASAVGGFGEERDGDGTFPYRAICADGAVLSENERYEQRSSDPEGRSGWDDPSGSSKIFPVLYRETPPSGIRTDRKTGADR